MVRAKHAHRATSRPRASVPAAPWGIRLTACRASEKNASVSESGVREV
jgi:hypothetical protein